MGLFNIFKSKRYDMDTLDGINAIPVPAKDYHTGKDTQDCIYYLLQRKATEHKKAGRDGCFAFQGRNRLEESAGGVLTGGYGYVRFPEGRDL